MAIRGGQDSTPPSTVHAVSVQLSRAGVCSPERGQEGKSTVWGEGCDVPNKCRAADAADPLGSMIRNRGSEKLSTSHEPCPWWLLSLGQRRNTGGFCVKWTC